MYLSYKLHTSYTFSVDQPSVLTILEGGSFSYKGKSMGHFSSKLTKVKGRDNPMGRSFVIINLEFKRKQKGGEPHYMHLLGERDMITMIENGKVAGTSNLYKSKNGKWYQRQGEYLNIG
jgi:hypothetical protein